MLQRTPKTEDTARQCGPPVPRTCSPMGRLPAMPKANHPKDGSQDIIYWAFPGGYVLRVAMRGFDMKHWLDASTLRCIGCGESAKVAESEDNQENCLAFYADIGDRTKLAINRDESLVIEGIEGRLRFNKEQLFLLWDALEAGISCVRRGL